jgi:cellulose synthase/poly-beta-1,6-N-acetylglucosamine synthase-like glycosyltransferase
MVSESLLYVGIAIAATVLVKLLWKIREFPDFLKMEIKAPSLRDRECIRPVPLLSVIIPANNEEGSIEKAARSVLASECSDLELILINDRSRDKTVETMQRLERDDSRVRVLSIHEVPPGWTGKSHALFRGAEVASGEILVFTDADAVMDPYTLHKSRELLLRDKLDVLSLIPGFTARGFIEDALYPILAFGLLNFYPLREVNDPAKPAALASGTFIMITREAYQKVGMWRSVRDEITEDIAFAKKAKKAGLRLTVLRGNELVRTEPFKRVSELFLYWKRVYYGGFERNGLQVARVAANHTALFLVYMLFCISMAMWFTSGATFTVATLLLVTLVTIAAVSIPQQAFLKRQHGNRLYGFAAPIGFLLGVCVSLSALLAIVFDKGILWHGSSYK